MSIVGITSITADPKAPAAIGATLGRYGLRALGGSWQTTADKVQAVDWRPMVDAFVAQRAALWLVLADAASMADPALRYGLNLMASSLRAALGAGLPIAVLRAAEAGKVSSSSSPLLLPAQLRDAQLLDADATWPAKVVARVHRPRAAVQPAPDLLTVHGNDQLGQWFELAPGEGSWPGLVFAVAGAGASIDFQATGPRGGLPEKAVIAYGQQGLKLESAGKAFTGWALRNEVGATEGGPVSYYARVRGRPEALLWMPYTEDDDAQATLLSLD